MKFSLPGILTSMHKEPAASFSELEPRLVDIFCSLFGEKYRNILTPETTMDDIPEWDSLSFIDVVCSIEEAYQIQFSMDQAAQLFNLGHIQNMIQRIQTNKPQEDVENAICLAQVIRNNSKGFNFVVMSGSSTREGLLLPEHCEKLLRDKSGNPDARWFNISVSGLTLAESLQLLETIDPWDGVLALGLSPIIMLGCGQAEFRRSVNYERFPFAAPKMRALLKKHGHAPENSRPPEALDIWVAEHLAGRNLSEMIYNPYLYPTLDPWPEEKYESREDFLRFYNDSVINFEESLRINTDILEAIIAWCRSGNTRLVLHELTLHSKAIVHLEAIGNIYSRYCEFRHKLLERYSPIYLDIPALAGITDSDFRDPAHLFRNKDIYTRTFIDQIWNVISS